MSFLSHMAPDETVSCWCVKMRRRWNFHKMPDQRPPAWELDQSVAQSPLTLVEENGVGGIVGGKSCIYLIYLFCLVYFLIGQLVTTKYVKSKKSMQGYARGMENITWPIPKLAFANTKKRKMLYSIGLGWAWDLKPLYLLPRFLNISNVFLRLGQQWISLQTRISTAGGAFNTCGTFTSQQCLTEVFLDLYCAWRPWFDWFLQRLKIEKQEWLEGESPAFSSTFCTSERFAVVCATVLHEGGDAHQGQGGRGRWRGGSGWPCSRCPWSRACHCRCSRPQTSSPQRPAGESQLSFEVQTIRNGPKNKIFNRRRSKLQTH